MSVLQDWLSEQIELVEIEKNQPNSPVEEGEEVIAVITDDFIKKLFCVMRDYSRYAIEEYNKTEEKINHDIISGKVFGQKGDDHDPETCPGCIMQRKFEPMVRRKEFLDNYLWTAIREEIGGEEQNASQIGIREGWKIVLRPEEEDLTLSEILLNVQNIMA